MAAYFVFTFFSIRNRVQVNFYEVEEGSLVKEHIYTGLILREETVVNAEENGDIYYYVADGRKVANGNPVYCLDKNGDLMNYLRSHAAEMDQLTTARTADIRTELLHDSRSFNNKNFKSLYSLKDSLNAQVIEYASMNIFSSLSDELKSQGISFREFYAPVTGTVCYYTDGMEDKSEADVSASYFNQSSYKKELIKAGDSLAAGMPAYKLITSENWKIVFPMSAEDVAEFSGRDALRISFQDKGFNTTANFKVIYGNDSNPYGVIDLDSYLVQFTSDRFINFEIVTNDVSGLKIPDKSITTKDFNIIPVSFLTSDDNGNQGFLKAVLDETGSAASSRFTATTIFNMDNEYCYIECSDKSTLQNGDYVVRPDGEERYQLGPVKSVTGAYNINKGYTVFKKVEILESANGYSIVRKGSSYGLSVYDHIVLDTATVYDGQILYR